METPTYSHLALAKAALTDTDSKPETTTGQRSKRFEKFISLGVALGILGMAGQASALVKQGDRGPEVEDLQQRLLELGYFNANVTGYFGSVTKSAVIEFQQDQGLSPDGVVGESTQASLREEARQEATKEAASDSLRLGDRSEAVRGIQERLAYAGFFVEQKSVVFDEATQEAVRQFQQAKGLTVDGIVGPQTMAALPKIGKSTPTPVENKESEPTPEPQKPTSFFENEDAPLSPFIRKLE
jgi:peptidoglycan hydrolase-like protein with peptidoglycan-binding domain